MSTTVAVLGPGAVGGAVAVPLALAGTRVICVARPDTAVAIRAGGLTLERRGEALRAGPEAVERLEESVDLLLITVKAPALDEALARVAGDVGAVVPLLNGLEHVEAIRARLGGRVVAGSVGLLEAYGDGPGRIVQTTSEARLTVAAEDVAAQLAAPGLDIRVEQDEVVLLWEKLARLAPLAAATALTQRTVGELRDDSEWRARLEDAVAEACAVAAADGAAGPTPTAQWEIIDAMPPELMTSTARDVAAGRPSELDAITGAVVRAGQRLGVETPALAGLLGEAEARCRLRSP